MREPPRAAAACGRPYCGCDRYVDAAAQPELLA
jgi:hypothetical protein